MTASLAALRADDVDALREGLFDMLGLAVSICSRAMAGCKVPWGGRSCCKRYKQVRC